MSKIVLAFLGGLNTGVKQSRQMRVVKDTLGPIVTDAFVGVCCKSMRKLCTDIKIEMLRYNEEVLRVKSETLYNGKVIPTYEGFPFNVKACAKMTSPKWNPLSQSSEDGLKSA